MNSLPEPEEMTSLVLRTDFGDDAAWDSLKAAIDGFEPGCATYVSDPAYAGVSIRALIDADATAGDDDGLPHLFVADTTTMTDGELPLLAVDLYTEPGRTFRVPPRWYMSVSANLSLANMDFEEYADAADGSGTFRGFDED